MTTTWGPIVYPTSLDSFTPALVDNVDEVIANHPNSLADAITAVETKLGITGGLATGFGAMAMTGLAASPAINTIWIDSSGGAGTYDLTYTDDSGVDYIIAGPGASSGDNTLDDAYNEGGAGAGRTIAVDSGAVLFTVSTGNNSVLELVQNNTVSSPDALQITNLGSSPAINLLGSGARTISSTSGNMTLQTLTTGTINVTSADDLDVDADSIYINANATIGGTLSIIGANQIEAYAANDMYISSEQVWITSYDDNTGPFLSVTDGGGGKGLSNSSGTGIWMDLQARLNQSGTAGYTVLKIDTDEATPGSGTKKLLDINYEGTPAVWITTDGVLHTTAKITGDAADLTLEGRSASITLNEAGDTALSGYTATSIIGALNEVLTLTSGTTLDGAYDGGGSGLGRAITVDSGAVTMTVPDTSNNAALELTQSDTTNHPVAMSITNAGNNSSLELAGTTRVINSTSAGITLQTTTSGDVNLTAATEILLDDGNRSGSTFSAAMKFSDTTTEWDDFESVFGEVSILSAITKAFGVPIANTDVDTGIEDVDSFADTAGGAAIWELIISNTTSGTDFRYSKVFAVWDAVNNTIEFSESGTTHIGDTSDLTLEVVINAGTTVVLRATAASDDWSVRGIRRVII